MRVVQLAPFLSSAESKSSYKHPFRLCRRPRMMVLPTRFGRRRGAVADLMKQARRLLPNRLLPAIWYSLIYLEMALSTTIEFQIYSVILSRRQSICLEAVFINLCLLARSALQKCRLTDLSLYGRFPVSAVWEQKMPKLDISLHE